MAKKTNPKHPQPDLEAMFGPMLDQLFGPRKTRGQELVDIVGKVFDVFNSELAVKEFNEELDRQLIKESKNDLPDRTPGAVALMKVDHDFVKELIADIHKRVRAHHDKHDPLYEAERLRAVKEFCTPEAFLGKVDIPPGEVNCECTYLFKFKAPKGKPFNVHPHNLPSEIVDQFNQLAGRKRIPIQ